MKNFARGTILGIVAIAVAYAAYLARYSPAHVAATHTPRARAAASTSSDAPDRGSVGRVMQLLAAPRTQLKHEAAPPQPPFIPDSWRVPFWAFDPSSTLSCASDDNTCTSATCGSGGVGPCLTLHEIVRRLGTDEPQFQQSTVLAQLSDDLPGFPNAIHFKPWVAYPSTFEYLGSLVQVGSATLGAYTALDRTAGTMTKITAQGQTGNFWAQYVTDLVADVTAGANFWIDSDLGAATAATSTPLQPWAPNTIPQYVTPAAGDSLIIYRPVHAWCAELGTKRYDIAAQHARHIYCDVGPGTPSVGDMPMPIVESQIDERAIISLCPDDLAGFYINDMLGSTAAEPLSSLLGLAGVWIGGDIKTADNVLSCGSLAYQTVLDGDILVKERQHLLNHSVLAIGRAGFFGGNALHTYSNFGQLEIGVWGPPGMYYSDTHMWGPSSLELDDGESLICEQNCTTQINLTGSLIIGTGSGQATFTTAFPWDDATASWSAPAQTITPAAIDAAAAMCRPSSGTCFYSRQLP